MTDPITTPAQMREASIYYIDCEFDGHSGPLLSLAMVRGDGYSTHIRVNLDAKDPWVQANVMPIMDSHNADVSETVDLVCVGQSIRDFIGTCQHPTIIADSPVDIWRFCAAISTASDGQWSSVDYPKISFAVHNVACYPTTLAGAVQHNAWWDAMALRDTLCRALPVAEPEPVAAVDLWPDKEDVSEAMSDKGYSWRPCSGCHETHEGVPTGPMHPVLGCVVGHGCYECGGIGAVWDTTDYAALGDMSQIEAVSVAQVRAEALEEAAKLATSFLVGDPKNGVPLRNPMAHEIAAAIRALMEKLE